MNDPLEGYISALETVDGNSIERVISKCSPDIHFRDPFNDCRGSDAYARVLQDMFEKLSTVDFKVDDASWVGPPGGDHERRALMHWRLSATFRSLKQRNWSIEGCSRVWFNGQKLVTAHHDYWDAASGLYESLPIVSPIMRLLRRRLSVT